MYISFVEGDYSKSGYQVGSDGGRLYFYYHTLDSFTTEMRNNELEMIKLFHKNYTKSDGAQEVHTIVIAKK